MRSRRRSAAVVVGAALLCVSAGLAPPATAAAPTWPAPAGDRGASRPLMAYLLTPSTIVPVDLGTRALGTPVPAPVRSDGMALSPDGRTAYVVLAGSLRPLDLVTGTLYPGTYIGRYASSVAVTPDGRTGWVLDGGSRDVTPVDLRTGRAGQPVQPGGGRPDVELSGIAITPDGRTGYVATGCRGLVYPVDLATRQVRAGLAPAPSSSSPCPADVAVAPDGRSGYIGAAWSPYGLSPFDVATETPRPPVRVSAAAPGDLVLTPDSGTVFVWTGSGVAAVDTRTDRVTLLPGDDLERGFAVHPSGRALLVPLAGGGVQPVDTTTYARGARFATGLEVRQVVVAPDQAPAAGFTATAGRGAHVQHFDASSSVGVTARIATYRWSFGDGTSRTTTTPVVDHTYAGAGRFQVRLTVTDVHGTSTTPVFASRMLLRNGGPRATTTRWVGVG